MATGGMIGNNTKVAYSTSSPVSWTKIGQLIDVDGIDLTADDVPTTVHGSSGFKSKMPGLIEVKDITLKILADLDEASTATHMALEGFLLDRLDRYWTIEVPANRAMSRWKRFEFVGYVKQWAVATPIGGGQEITVVLGFDGSSLGVYAASGSATIS